MSANSFEQLFRRPELRRLADIMRAAQSLDACWQAVLPEDLRGKSQAVSVYQGELIVATRQSALAAKLRQLAVRLTQALNAGGLEVNGIRVRLQVEVLPHQGEKTNINHALSEKALAAFDDAVSVMADSPLRDAMARLLERRRSGKA